MDYRAVITFLCLLISQATCLPVRRVTHPEALNRSIPLVRKGIHDALKLLYRQNAAPAVLPNITCSYLNITVQVGPEQQPLTERHLSCFRCYMRGIPALTPELSSNLSTIRQYTQSMERLMREQINHLGCRLPTFENEMDKYEYVRSLLQLLDQRLNETKF